MANDFDFKTKEGKNLNICTLDIEATALDAQFGYMLCACVKSVLPNSLKGAIKTFRIDAPNNKDINSDRQMIKDLVEYVNKFDLVVTWYGSQYDLPFINTRALLHQVPTLDRNYRRDLCLCARAFGKLKNNRLATWDRFLFGDTLKTSVDWKYWLGAIRNDKKSINYIVDHCQKDVMSTERIYKRTMGLLGKLRKV